MNEYILKGEEGIKICNDHIEKSGMKFERKEKSKYHLDVLPHPYFGDVENAEVLFLAKNPSYDRIEDEYDTWIYKRINTENINLDNEKDAFYEALKSANFLKGFKEEENMLFYNAWKWWNKKVIGENVVANNPEKFAFVNLCGYHSKSFNPSYYLENSIIQKINFDNLKLIIYVWGKDDWINSKTFKENDDIIKKIPSIVLNEYYDKNHEGKTGQNIISISKILRIDENSIPNGKTKKEELNKLFTKINNES